MTTATLEETPANLEVRIDDLLRSAKTPKALAETRVVLQAWKKSYKKVGLAPLLPLMFRLRGKPYSLKDYLPMKPLFHVHDVPRKSILKTGRQVSKSTVLAHQGVALSLAIPYFNTLFITPLYEQIRRFSHNYVRQALKSCTLYKKITDGGSLENVLQRSLANQSTMHFTFAFLDCERVRGYNIDATKVDECLAFDTAITCVKDGFPIDFLTPSTKVWAFDDKGQLTVDRVVSTKNQGVKDVWRITTSDGRFVECSERELLRTDQGWVYAEELIRASRQASSSNPLSDPDGSWNADGGWEHVPEEVRGKNSGEYTRKKARHTSEILHNPRIEAGGVLQPQSSSVVELCEHSTEDHREQGVGKRELCVLDPMHKLPRLGVQPGLQASQTRNARVARLDDHRSDSLVVHGRWLIVGQTYYVLYSWFQPGGERVDFSVAYQQGVRGEGAACVERSERILVHPLGTGFRVLPAGGDAPIHPSFNGLQVTGAESSGSSALRQVWNHCLSQPEEHFELQLLRELSKASKSGCNEEVHRDSQRRDLCVPCELQSQSRFGSATRSSESLTREETGALQEAQERLPRENEGRPGVPGEDEEAQPELLCQSSSGPTKESGAITEAERTEEEAYARPSVQGEDTSPADSPSFEGERVSAELEYCDIVSIEYVGQEEVWDIETENHHTFFANGIAVHNCQGMDRTFLPVILATMDASPWRMLQMSGTPMSMDNLIEEQWQLSSMAEWAIKCEACNYTSVATVHQDLMKMIGKHGLICAKCGKPINTEQGYWLHGIPERRKIFEGRHAPQPIFPMHCRNASRWRDLLAKIDSFTEYSLMTEVMGESWDVGARLVTLTDLRAACVLPWRNEAKEAAARIDNSKYQFKVLAIDWSGGGAKEESLTAFTVLGVTSRGYIDVLWMKKYQHTTDYTIDAARAKEAYRIFGCFFLAHDFSGAGAGREQILVHSGFPLEKIVPVSLVRAHAQKALMVYNPPTQDYVRSSFSLDKARSLTYTCELIKAGYLRFPEFSSSHECLKDFLALVEETLITPRGSDLFLIGKASGVPDDVAQAINIGVSAIYHRLQKWPNVANARAVNQTLSALKEADPTFMKVPKVEL